MQRINITASHYPSALRRLVKKQPEAAVKALRKAAREGHTRVVAASKTSGSRASGTYERSWVVMQTQKGAIIGNTAEHAIFVEQGRRPGRMPPRKAIAEWLLQKKVLQKVTGGGSKRDAAMRVAYPIAKAIGRRGTEGYYIMKSVMPAIEKAVAREIRVAWKGLG